MNISRVSVQSYRSAPQTISAVLFVFALLLSLIQIGWVVTTLKNLVFDNEAAPLENHLPFLLRSKRCTMSPPSDDCLKELIQANGGIVIFTATYYASTDDVRFRMCMNTVHESVAHGVPMVVVDGSPSEAVRTALAKAGAIVRHQTARGRKGVALREAASVAAGLPGVGDDVLLCWQEPEKSGMIGLWRGVWDALEGPHVGPRQTDAVVPYRDPTFFRETYPVEQFHSETYGNLYLDAVASEALRQLGTGGLPRVISSSPFSTTEIEEATRGLDWHFGPFAFRAKHTILWTAYEGESYDAQLVPLVHAMRKGLSIASVRVNYLAPREMKDQEEGNVEFIEKRLWQLNELDPRVKEAWMEDFYRK